MKSLFLRIIPVVLVVMESLFTLLASLFLLFWGMVPLINRPHYTEANWRGESLEIFLCGLSMTIFIFAVSYLFNQPLFQYRSIENSKRKSIKVSLILGSILFIVSIVSSLYLYAYRPYK